MKSLPVELRDAFGGVHINTVIELTEEEVALLDSKECRVPFLFPGSVNDTLSWYLVFHGEEVK